jgi:hypothetical protein
VWAKTKWQLKTTIFIWIGEKYAESMFVICIRLVQMNVMKMETNTSAIAVHAGNIAAGRVPGGLQTINQIL